MSSRNIALLATMVFFDTPEEFLQVPTPATLKCHRDLIGIFDDEDEKSSCAMAGGDMWAGVQGSMTEFEPDKKPAKIPRHQMAPVMLDFTSYSAKPDQPMTRANYCERRKRPREEDDGEAALPVKKVAGSCLFSETRRHSDASYPIMEIQALKNSYRMRTDTKLCMPRVCMIPAIPIPMPQFCFFDFMFGGMTFLL